MLKRGLLLILSGPSGAGKNTLLNEVIKTDPELIYSVSASTRPPRPHEKDGINYFFLSPQEFTDRIHAGEFLEWAEFCGYHYGTPKDFVEKKLNTGKKVILDIDIQGARQIRERMPEAIFIFLMPPNMNILQKRLRGRATEAEEVIRSRLQKARNELECIYDYDYVIINDDLSKATQRLYSIITAEALRRERLDCPKLIHHVIGEMPCDEPTNSRRTSRES